MTERDDVVHELQPTATYNTLQRVTTYELGRVQSARLRAAGGPKEEGELKSGIEEKLEQPGQKDRRVLAFEPGDPENPHNWSSGKRWLITIVQMLTVSNSTFNSSLTSGAMPFIKEGFKVASTEVATLTMSLFLVGYVLGPIICAPLSEFSGRRWVSIGFFAWFTVSTICCAVSPNIGALLAFRFLAGIGASAPLSVGGGVLADIWPEPIQRGRTMGIFGAVTMIGPACSPFITGFISKSSAGWRMSFWLAAMIAGLSFITVLWCPETFAPAILRRKAQRLRKAGETNVIAPIELEERKWTSVLATAASRPFRMFFFESIVLLTSLFLSLLYGTFYLFFQSFPIIYAGIYEFKAGFSGLPFLGVGLGSFLAIGAIIPWDSHIERMKNANKPISDEYRRLPLACIGAPLYVGAMFWQAWTAKESVHWMVPIAAGVPFGFGFSVIFNAYINYLCDFYEIYAASALAAASMCRSIFGAAFPLFAPKMYDGLGVSWATSLLGFLALGMGCLPFLFIKYGDFVRSKSKFRQFLNERKEMLDDSGVQTSGPADPSGDLEKEAALRGTSSTTSSRT